MKTNRKILASLILATGIGGASFVIAQPGMGMKGGCDGMGSMGRHASMKFDPAAFVGERLDYMKYQLKITAEQESLWNAFAEKMQARAGKGMQGMRAAADEKLSAPERMARMQASMEEHLAALKDTNESFSRLYAALTPEQKAIADQQAARMGMGMGGRGGPRGGAATQG